MKYEEMKIKHQKEYNEFPMMCALSDEQFNEGMKKLGLDPEKDIDKMCRIAAGVFIRKSDKQALIDMFRRQAEEEKAAKQSDKEFAKKMFISELNDREFAYTMDYTETIKALGYTKTEIKRNARLRNGLNEAIYEILKADGHEASKKDIINCYGIK